MCKDLKLKPFRPICVQFLTPGDKDRRLENCQNILQAYPNKKSRDNTFFTDECAIYGDGNSRSFIWAKENPRYYEQIQQYPPQAMIWCAISAKHLIGPFVCQRVTSETYIQMLQDQFLPEVRRRRLKDYIFQQDGAPAHTALATRDFLNTHFPNRWIGKFGPVPWPPRSPDLTTPDNALWGILKKKIINIQPVTRENLVQVTEDLLNKIDDDKDLLQRMSDRTWRRIQIAVDVSGEQVDHHDI